MPVQSTLHAPIVSRKGKSSSADLYIHKVAELENQQLQVLLASFPGLPHLQLLIASSMQKRRVILEAIKSWRCGRPGNEAIGFTVLVHVHCAIIVWACWDE